MIRTPWHVPLVPKLIGFHCMLLGNLRTTTTTGSELQCPAQARPVDFVVVVSSTTPNKVESRPLQSTRASAGINSLF